jgi:hypothetical protein
VLNEGRPRLIADIEPLAQGIINILIPGNMGGDALANLVSGKSNFSGKMPYTYPKEINSLANYDFKKSEEVGTMEGAYDYNAKITQQWGFGYGLSYTSYKYSNLKVSHSAALKLSERISFSFMIIQYFLIVPCTRLSFRIGVAKIQRKIETRSFQRL